MRKVTIKEIKNYFKSRDTWTERFIFFIFSVPLAWLVLRSNQSKKLPYLLTIGNLVIYLIGAYYLSSGLYRIAGILWFIAMIIDNIDGVIARFIYGQDPPQRGSLDLIIDSFAASIILLTIFFVMMKTAIYFCAFLVFLYVIFLFLLYVQTSTVYRLRSEFSERLKDIVVNKEDEGHYKFLPSFLVNAYFKIDKFTAKHRTLVHPTACDSAFIIYVILPLLNFNFYTPLLIIAILFIILDIFQELVIILSYFRNL